VLRRRVALRRAAGPHLLPEQGNGCTLRSPLGADAPPLPGSPLPEPPRPGPPLPSHSLLRNPGAAVGVSRHAAPPRHAFFLSTGEQRHAMPAPPGQDHTPPSSGGARFRSPRHRPGHPLARSTCRRPGASARPQHLPPARLRRKLGPSVGVSRCGTPQRRAVFLSKKTRKAARSPRKRGRRRRACSTGGRAGARVRRCARRASAAAAGAPRGSCRGSRAAGRRRRAGRRSKASRHRLGRTGRT
jgi:hypothetical protein